MIKKREDGKMVIKGRIDSNNAQIFEEEMFKVCPQDEEIHIDASELTYISSAGLRVFMKLKKMTHKEIYIENVSNEIYDIFEVTGFTDIFKVQKRLREISVENCEVIGEGANGKVYRLDDETIIKVFAPGVPMSIVQEERDIARSAFVSGVPTAISYDVANVGDSYGAVYEMLHAKTLSAFVMDNPDRCEEMGRRMGSLLKELHNTKADVTKFTDKLEMYRGRVRKMEKYLTDRELDKLMSVYDVLDEHKTLLHGDFHAKNIMYMDGELIFIDMGDAGYGHPLLDIGGSYLGMVHVGKVNPSIVPKYIGVDFEKAMILWDNMLLAYFGEEQIEEGKKLAEIYGEAKYMLTPLIYTKASEEMSKALIERTRKNGFISDNFDIEPALNMKIRF